MWLAGEVSRSEYRRMKQAVVERIEKRQKVVEVRPVVALEGVTGPNAREAFRVLGEAGEFERINAIFALLFEAVIIKPTDKRGRGLDLSRIEIRKHAMALAA